jgi:hypothetical protein
VKNLVAQISRFGLTALAVAVACFIGVRLWAYYMDAPWTRDGHVRADVVQVAPDVSGFAPGLRWRYSRPMPSLRATALRWIRPMQT